MNSLCEKKSETGLQPVAKQCIPDIPMLWPMLSYKGHTLMNICIYIL